MEIIETIKTVVIIVRTVSVVQGPVEAAGAGRTICWNSFLLIINGLGVKETKSTEAWSTHGKTFGVMAVRRSGTPVPDGELLSSRCRRGAGRPAISCQLPLTWAPLSRICRKGGSTALALLTLLRKICAAAARPGILG